MMNIIEAVRIRDPFFDGWETEKARYAFRCHLCGEETSICFKAMLDAAWSWKDSTQTDLKALIAANFGIDLNNKYIGDGMDAVVVAQCSKCVSKACVYLWFHEYRNSCYQISLRGLAAIT